MDYMKGVYKRRFQAEIEFSNNIEDENNQLFYLSSKCINVR